MSWKHVFKKQPIGKGNEVLNFYDGLNEWEYHCIRAYFDKLMYILFYIARGSCYEEGIAKGLMLTDEECSTLLKSAESVGLIKYDKNKVSLKVLGLKYMSAKRSRQKKQSYFPYEFKYRDIKVHDTDLQFERGSVLVEVAKHTKGSLKVAMIESAVNVNTQYAQRNIYLAIQKDKALDIILKYPLAIVNNGGDYNVIYKQLRRLSRTLVDQSALFNDIKKAVVVLKCYHADGVKSYSEKYVKRALNKLKMSQDSFDELIVYEFDTNERKLSRIEIE